MAKQGWSFFLFAVVCAALAQATCAHAERVLLVDGSVNGASYVHRNKDGRRFVGGGEDGGNRGNREHGTGRRMLDIAGGVNGAAYGGHDACAHSLIATGCGGGPQQGPGNPGPGRRLLAGLTRRLQQYGVNGASYVHNGNSHSLIGGSSGPNPGPGRRLEAATGSGPNELHFQEDGAGTSSFDAGR